MNPVSVGDDLVERLNAAYLTVAEWPERRMPGVDITTLGSGFNDLLSLRNLVPEAAARIIAVEAERDKLRQIISDCAKALTNGAFIAPSASVEFMALLPSEIAAATANFLTMQGAAAKLLEDANSYKASAETNLARATKAEARNSVLEAERDAAEEAENEAKDCFWAIYPDYLEMGGKPVSTEAARTALAEQAAHFEKLLSGRDEFIGERGLWQDFVDTLPLTPEPS